MTVITDISKGEQYVDALTGEVVEVLAVLFPLRQVRVVHRAGTGAAMWSELRDPEDLEPCASCSA
jgi:hypothetical protein